jgi:small subunit ribosomal protein S1
MGLPARPCRHHHEEHAVTEPEEDFASMFEASTKARRVGRGETVEGTVVAIGEEVAFVDIGGKGEATIDLAELRDADGQVEVAPGDRIEAIVLSTAGGITLSRRLARGAATDRQLEDAYQAGLPVEGKIERAVKGGYEVRIGRSRAFCPFSQIGMPVNDPATQEGQVYEFRIVEYSDNGRTLVVSRRALVAEAQQARAAEVKKALAAGAILTGRVVSVRDFGAFIDLGAGVQGLLHVSEMAWSRVSQPSDIVKPGDEIAVKVLRVDDETGRIALGLKQLSADPWTRVGENYEVGQLRVGRVTRVAEFGAFVEFEPGIEGLAHQSTFAPTGRAGGWTGSVTPGTVGAFEILTIDLDKKRIGVALVVKGEQPEASAAATSAAIVPGARLKGKVERHEKFGVFVFLAPGRIGLVPNSETGVAGEAEVKKAFPVGAEVEVVVLEVDPAGRRIRLSAKAVLDAREAAEVREYNERPDNRPSGGFGSSLADKLRGALKPRP